jgi:exodeoxyribonuclease-3
VYHGAVKLISWNVNGFRAVLRKKALDLVLAESPDVICLQETRCGPDDIEPFGGGAYAAFWNEAPRKGYSGTATFTRIPPLRSAPGIGVAAHDGEGRVLSLEFPEFFLVNAYVPNSQRELARLPYRRRWDRAFLRFLTGLERRKPVIACGDFNVAHTELDLARPKANVGNHGFTPEERAGFGALVRAGFLDTFRELEPEAKRYTWWSPNPGVRERNVGWRIDYVLISKSLRPRLRRAFIRDDILGSDHCPVGIILAP